jgi:predicted signal transduction protein with EAL and GGDEF domain
VGDLLLIEIASVLRGLVRATDTISRVSGDEFVLVTDDLSSVEDNTAIIQKIVDRFQEPFYIKNNPFEITFSIGISVYPNDAQDEQSLLKYADMAMYRAKNSGKNRYIYYDESMNSDILEHIKIEQEIRRGIENDEFVLHYQPQFQVGTKKIVGFEALVRWEHPELGLKYPDYFIQIAENSNLMIPLGRIISKKAMEQISSWYKKGLNPGVVSINFTTKQLEEENFFDDLKDLLKETECRAEWVEAELIERYVMRDTEKTTNLLKYFKDIGMQVAIDDFGTGYSSLSYLKYLEISKLKIDKAFIDELEFDMKDRAIAKSIIDLSIGLNLKVLAEGVETKKQYEILEELGCQIIQGYYFSRPVSADTAENLLLNNLDV